MMKANEKKQGEQKSKSKEDNFLLYVPRKKHEEWKTEKGKVKLIFHHDKAAEKFVRWLVKKPYTSDIELDELGSKVWSLIDGNRSVFEIGKELKLHFGDACEPIYDRLIMYLRYLNKKSWISFSRGDQGNSNS